MTTKREKKIEQIVEIAVEQAKKRLYFSKRRRIVGKTFKR